MTPSKTVLAALAAVCLFGASAARASEAILVVAQLGSQSLLSANIPSSFIQDLRAKMPKAVIDLALVGDAKLACGACDRVDSLKSPRGTAIKVGWSYNAHTGAAFRSAAAQVARSSVQAPDVVPALESIFTAFGNRRVRQYKTAFIFARGTGFTQNGEIVEEGGRYTSVPGVTADRNTVDWKSLEEASTVAQNLDMAIHIVETPRQISLRVHVDPRGRCYYETRNFIVSGSSTGLGALASATGGSYAEAMDFLKTGGGANVMSPQQWARAVQAGYSSGEINGWTQRVISEVAQAKTSGPIPLGVEVGPGARVGDSSQPIQVQIQAPTPRKKP